MQTTHSAPANSPERHAPNSWTRDRLDGSRLRFQHLRDDRNFQAHIEIQQNDFRSQHLENFRSRGLELAHFHSDFHDRYRPLWRHGFRGGYAYGLHPFISVHRYIGIPLWSWFYIPTIDIECNRAYYGADFDRFGILASPYVGVVYPTVEFRDVTLAVSDLSFFEQANFRYGMTSALTQIAQVVANQLQTPVVMRANEVVINSYQIIPGRGVVIEGYFVHDYVTAGFKGLVSLNQAAPTMLYIPGLLGDLQYLGTLNAQIEALGGVVNRSDE